MVSVSAYIQARLSSSRFPGKVLAPFRGKPIIEHVIEAVKSVPAVDQTVVVTSIDPSDDLLVAHLEQLDCPVLRGPLHDVFRRFQLAAKKYPCDWVLRLCADSPLLSPRVVHEVTRHAAGDTGDVVTTRFAPPFPKGQNADMIRSEVLLGVDPAALTAHDLEHVTPWFYRNRDRYRIIDANRVQIGLRGTEFAVDTREDLQRLERLVSNGNREPTSSETSPQ